MSQCSSRYLPLCSIPKLVSKDGWTGPNAHIYLPFSAAGFYFFSGDTYNFPGSTVAQDQSRTFGGVSKPGSSYHKEGGWCGGQI